MGGFLKELWPFGGKDEPEKVSPPKRTPSMGAGTGTATTVTRHPVEPTSTVPGGQSAPVVTPGDPIDEQVGDPVLSRMVDPSASQFKILGRAEHYGPGETVRFFVQAISYLQSERRDIPNAGGFRVPLAGLPVIVKNKTQKRQLGPRVITDEQGVAVIPYLVTEQDQLDGSDPNVPDGGSYLCNAYIGGRLLNTVVPLWDEA